jgi:hypothetical protein
MPKRLMVLFQGVDVVVGKASTTGITDKHLL